MLQWAPGVVVSRPLRIRKALGSIPSVPIEDIVSRALTSHDHRHLEHVPEPLCSLYALSLYALFIRSLCSLYALPRAKRVRRNYTTCPAQTRYGLQVNAPDAGRQISCEEKENRTDRSGSCLVAAFVALVRA